jgi:hypothetical protein
MPFARARCHGVGWPNSAPLRSYLQQLTCVERQIRTAHAHAHCAPGSQTYHVALRWRVRGGCIRLWRPPSIEWILSRLSIGKLSAWWSISVQEKPVIVETIVENKKSKAASATLRLRSEESKQLIIHRGVSDRMSRNTRGTPMSRDRRRATSVTWRTAPHRQRRNATRGSVQFSNKYKLLSTAPQTKLASLMQ